MRIGQNRTWKLSNTWLKSGCGGAFSVSGSECILSCTIGYTTAGSDSKAFSKRPATNFQKRLPALHGTGTLNGTQSRHVAVECGDGGAAIRRAGNGAADSWLTKRQATNKLWMMAGRKSCH